MEYLYNWFFTFNPYTGKYAACQSEDIPTLKNNHDTDRAIRSSKWETLREMIIRGEGSLEKIKQIYI